MLSMFDIIKINGYDPNEFRFVRHGNAEIQILDTFKTDIDKFIAYQSFQSISKFGNSKHIAAFAPGRGTKAIFLGVWDVLKSVKPEEFNDDIRSLIPKYSFPDGWYEHEWYDLKINNDFSDYSERLIIEWGKATVAWVQNKDKQVVELKAHNSIDQFYSYDDIQLSYQDMRTIIKNTDSNYIWYTALSSVNGIYLIRDKSNGKLYIGSAYGEDGIWGRWKTYSQNGHGGNEELKLLNPINFEFSVLEIISSVVSIDEVIERENRWKDRIGTRIFGLNKN